MIVRKKILCQIFFGSHSGHVVPACMGGPLLITGTHKTPCQQSPHLSIFHTLFSPIPFCYSFCCPLQIIVSIIPLLDNNDWERLGVSAIGDRIVLVQLSKSHGEKLYVL